MERSFFRAVRSITYRALSCVFKEIQASDLDSSWTPGVQPRLLDSTWTPDSEAGVHVISSQFDPAFHVLSRVRARSSRLGFFTSPSSSGKTTFLFPYREILSRVPGWSRSNRYEAPDDVRRRAQPLPSVSMPSPGLFARFPTALSSGAR
jgi:hypothetical protein